MSELQEARWYVVHTYSGHENKVKATIEKAVKTRGMEQFIQEVVVPTEDVVETTKTGKEKVRQRKIYPSYVLIKMIITDESWYIVRNTKGVTGFVGPGSKPVPLTDTEMLSLGIKNEKVEVDFKEGDMIAVIGGVWSGTAGVVKRIDENRQTVTINVDMFGRETPVELNFTEVKKMN